MIRSAGSQTNFRGDEKPPATSRIRSAPTRAVSGRKAPDCLLGFRKELYMSVEETRRAETLFKKEQQLREAEKAMAEYRAELQATREKTARLRALRLAREAANQKGAAGQGTPRFIDRGCVWCS